MLTLSLPQKDMSKEKICFIHVPKCGGTSLNEAFRKSLSISPFSLKAHKIDSVKTMKEAKRQGVDHLVLRRQLLKQKLKQKSLRYLTGHAPCSSEMRHSHDNEWNFITVLRNPVDRFISAYFFNKYKKLNHRKHDMSLDEYLNSSIAQENGQMFIRYFASEGNMTNQDAWEEAVDNLKGFGAVGILENLDVFQESFETLMGKKLAMGRQRNMNPVSQEEMKKKVSKFEMERIIEICQPDLKVYNSIRAKS